MANGKHPLIAREGWVHVGIVVVAAAAVHYSFGHYWALPFWLIVVFVGQFFRDPHRKILPGVSRCWLHTPGNGPARFAATKAPRSA